MFFLQLFLFIFLSWSETTQNRVVSPGDVPSERQESCSPLALGSSMIVNDSFSESPTGVQRRYRLRRDSRDSRLYHVDIPMSFAVSLEAAIQSRGQSSVARLSPNDRDPGDSRPSSVLGPKVARAEMSTAFIIRTTQCFASMRDKLYSSDGTKIQLHLSNGSSEIDNNMVAVAPSQHRSNMGSWSRDIDCSGIIHEALHLLGLCDGYPEGRYNCRSIEPEHSIMSNDRIALSETFDLLNCGPGQNSGATNLSQAPSVSSMTCSNGGARQNIMTHLTRDQMNRYRDQHPQDQLFYSRSENQRPPLFPAHTRLITQPYCGSANERYINCSKNSIRGKAEGCLPSPSYCGKGSTYLQ